jgi:hypothetical protein
MRLSFPIKLIIFSLELSIAAICTQETYQQKHKCQEQYVQYLYKNIVFKYHVLHWALFQTSFWKICEYCCFTVVYFWIFRFILKNLSIIIFLYLSWKDYAFFIFVWNDFDLSFVVYTLTRNGIDLIYFASWTCIFGTMNEIKCAIFLSLKFIVISCIIFKLRLSIIFRLITNIIDNWLEFNS